MEKFLRIIKNGIFIGLILIVTAYLGIYFIAGDTAFEQEILNLSDINIFTRQLVTTSIIGIVISCLIEYGKIVFEKMKESEKQADMNKSIKNVLLGCFPLFVFSIGTLIFIDKITMTYSANIGMMYIIYLVVGMSTLGLIGCIKSSIEELLINKKIKELNKK